MLFLAELFEELFQSSIGTNKTYVMIYKNNKPITSQSPIGTKQNNEFISAVGHESTAYQSPIGTQKTTIINVLNRVCCTFQSPIGTNKTYTKMTQSIVNTCLNPL